MNLIIELIIGWTKAGIVAWIVLAIASLIYIIYAIPTVDLATGKLDEVEDGSEKASKVRIIARTFIWPWGIYEVSCLVYNAIKTYKEQS